MNFYHKKIEEIYKSLRTNENGLSEEEAQKRLKQYGYNIILDGKKKTKFSLFLKQFKNLMIILLLVVGVLSLF